MPSLNDLVLDNGLSIISGSNRRLDICSAEPTTYTAATSTLSLGNKTGLTVPAPVARTPSGRKVVVPQVVSGAAGSVTGTDDATHWALTDPANSRLLVAGALSAGQVVTSGNTWTTNGAIDVGLPGAT
jgi:hypothetical protein